MKKILFAFFILVSVVGYSQPTTITGYTTINNKYNWLPAVFRGINIPAGTTPALATGQWVGFGGLYADSTGGNKGIHYWNGTAWVRLVDTTYTGLASSNTSIGTGFPVAWDGTNQIRKIAGANGVSLDSSTSNTITVKFGQTFNQVGDPSAFANNREIYTAGNQFKIRNDVAGQNYFLINHSDNDGVYRFYDHGLLETILYSDGFDYGWVKNWINNSYDSSVTHVGYGSAASGLYITNRIGGAGQFYLGFPGNSIINDGFLIRGTGAGGVRIAADAGNIVFTSSASAATEYGRFITAGRFGIGTTTPGQKLSVGGSFSNNDSVIHSNLARITDTTGFDIAVLDRTTGNMKKIYPGILGGVNIYNSDGTIPAATTRTVSIGAASDLIFFGANSNEIKIGGGASSTAGDVLIDAEAGNVHLNSPNAIVAQSDSFRTQRGANVHQIADSAGWYFKIRNKLTGTEADAYWPAPGGASGITIGSTTITGGSSPNILYHTTEGFVGEYSVTGSGTTAVLSTSPTFTTSIIDTLVIGSTSANGRLVLTGNNNAAGNTGTLVNTTIAVGNSSATPALRAYNSGEVTINGATYDANHALVIKSLDNTVLHGVKILANNETAALNIGYNGFSYSGVLTVEGLGGINIQGASSAVYGKMTSAGLWNIGGSNTGTSSLTVQGSFAPTLTTSAIDITLTSAHTTMILTATGKTATLPTAVGIQGRIYTIKLSASGTGTVATTSSQTIDGSTTYSLSAQYKYVTVQSDNANWHIIANNSVELWVIVLLIGSLIYNKRKYGVFRIVTDDELKQAA